MMTERLLILHRPDAGLHARPYEQSLLLWTQGTLVSNFVSEENTFYFGATDNRGLDGITQRPSEYGLWLWEGTMMDVRDPRNELGDALVCEGNWRRLTPDELAHFNARGYLDLEETK